MRALAAVLVGASAVFDLWVAVSWLDIALTNCDPAKTAAAWNLFVLAF